MWLAWKQGIGVLPFILMEWYIGCGEYLLLGSLKYHVRTQVIEVVHTYVMKEAYWELYGDNMPTRYKGSKANTSHRGNKLNVTKVIGQEVVKVIN